MSAVTKGVEGAAAEPERGRKSGPGATDDVLPWVERGVAAAIRRMLKGCDPAELSAHVGLATARAEHAGELAALGDDEQMGALAAFVGGWTAVVARRGRDVGEPLPARTADSTPAVEALALVGHELRTHLSTLHVSLKHAATLLDRESATMASKPEATSEATWSQTLLAPIRIVVERARRSERSLTALVATLADEMFTTATPRLSLAIVDLCKLLRELLDELAWLFVDARCPLELRLPDSATGVWDVTRVRQALTNLLANAVKFGPGKPIGVAVGVSSAEVSVSINDQGPGFVPDEVSTLFERFTKGRNGRGQPGLGLGLYVVKRIVDAHGGRVFAHCAPELGTTFSFTLSRTLELS